MGVRFQHHLVTLAKVMNNSVVDIKLEILKLKLMRTCDTAFAFSCLMRSG